MWVAKGKNNPHYGESNYGVLYTVPLGHAREETLVHRRIPEANFLSWIKIPDKSHSSNDVQGPQKTNVRRNVNT